MIPSFIDRRKLPQKSGVYIFKDQENMVLYIGKAISLYHRVASYFNQNVSGKTQTLVSKISSVEAIIVESELEALILEANLIKKYLPTFNVRLTDDKDYLYIGITKEDFPKIITIRKQDLPAGRQGLKKVKKFFGPFPSSRTVKDTLKKLRRVFPWCSNPPKTNAQTRFVNSNPNRWATSPRLVWKAKACFYYHLGLCPGSCVGAIGKEDYNKIINRFSKFLEGKKEELVSDLFEDMKKCSETQNFEEAGKIKKIIEGINYLTQINRSSVYLENPNFLEDERKLALETLQKDLKLEKLPERIEGYDISNIGGKEAVGSMVVLTNGEIDKSQYRKFKIRITGRPNDVGMHREMMRRRLRNDWLLPDLIIVDGGRGQARAANVQIQVTSYKIPVFGLAKRLEWLYPPQGEIIKLSRKSLSLKLLQRLRDEAHRFAITYHRKLHRKSIFNIV